VNGRLLALGHDLQRLLQAPGTFAACAGESLVAGRCSGSQIPQLIEALQADVAAPREPVTSRLARIAGLEIRNLESGWARDGSRLLAHAWELCESNGTALRDDFEGAGIDARARVDPGVHLLVPESIRIESGARLRPGVVLDAESGPITIAAGADLQAHVVIRGPAWIGPGCLLKTGTAIQGDTSLGPVCKVGGEIGGSILQGFANKQHEGYLGHAFLGEWVNLGADTTNSDLKNNYGSVRMWEDGRFVDTGLLFVGLVAADHVKTAINTQLNTGTVLGLASQVAGPGFPPKYVPPFSWCSPRGIEVYDFERALRTARTVMARRERELTPAYAAALRRVFAAARDEKR
jgi:UDP-N-acetylglucosamine diphosphorylase/glucosamine-1-phosphate N-acetyltransferase